MKKICTRCGLKKDASKFGTHITGKDKLNAACRICKRLMDKEREHTPKRRFSRYKARAKKKNRIFNVSFEEFENITDKRCVYCGGLSDSQHGEKFCGIDRIDSDKGYIKDNMVPCCDICNYMKATLTCEEFTVHIKKIYNHLKNGAQVDLPR